MGSGTARTLISAHMGCSTTGGSFVCYARVIPKMLIVLSSETLNLISPRLMNCFQTLLNLILSAFSLLNYNLMNLVLHGISTPKMKATWVPVSHKRISMCVISVSIAKLVKHRNSMPEPQDGLSVEEVLRKWWK